MDTYISVAKPVDSLAEDPRAELTRHYSDEIPDISLHEISVALKQLKNNKAPGEDGITSELLKAGELPVLRVLQKLFNAVLLEGPCRAMSLHVAPIPVSVGSSILEVVDEYVYLGQKIRLGRSNFEGEVNRRIQLGWAAFGNLRSVFSSGIPQCLKSKVFDQCVLPAMTYGTETWPLTKGLLERLKVTQRAMERAMLGISLRDRVRNEEIRRRT